MGVSQEEFAALIGLSSKGNVSIIERENRCGLRVALKIEQLSEGRVNAADLNEEVRLSRHGLDHVATDTSGTVASSSGSCGGISPDCLEVDRVAGGAVTPAAADGVALVHRMGAATPEGCGVREAGA